MFDNNDDDNFPNTCDSNYDQPRYPCPICKYDCDVFGVNTIIIRW